MPILNETFLLYTACLFYSIALVITYLGGGRVPIRYLVLACILGLVNHSLSLVLRWDRVGHGPFINLYEILSSNLWSLMLGLTCFMLLAPRLRGAVGFIIPLPGLLMIWLLLTTPRDTYLPATYDTLWLYFHVLSGKFFLALLMLATGLALYEYRRQGAENSSSADTAIESPSYRLLAFAFCFESMMLLFGAIWAQDAWGRYWAWDPLETWAFLTWICVIFVLHWRQNHPHKTVYAILVGICLVMAFLTFFGVPFVSTAPHKGMI
ncbi:MAG TPA: cytochrome c biogenesis protein CcsA [Gammaproteobacteria bacterium]|nr:cytochrome c biogenesis protein CcsA [Gammaproteobacteria bacterium]